VAPEFQGLGFGKRLFETARKDLSEHGYSSFLVWALADNERAVQFYGRLGGVNVRQANERFGSEVRARHAFAFDSAPT
jgi:ribosomal protein S18 acetylase RimI-like enzyme